jgi:hypothetical protein
VAGLFYQLAAMLLSQHRGCLGRGVMQTAIVIFIMLAAAIVVAVTIWKSR